MFRFDERIAALKAQAGISKPKDVLPDALALIDELHRAYQAAWADECNSTMAACGLQADVDNLKEALLKIDALQFEGLDAGDTWKSIRQIINQCLNQEDK